MVPRCAQCHPLMSSRVSLACLPRCTSASQQWRAVRPRLAATYFDADIRVTHGCPLPPDRPTVHTNRDADDRPQCNAGGDTARTGAACILNGTATPATIAPDGASVQCVTPPLESAGDANLEITLNGTTCCRQWSMTPTASRMVAALLCYSTTTHCRRWNCSNH